MSEKKYTEEDIERAKVFVDSLLEKPEFQEELRVAKESFKDMVEKKDGKNHFVEALSARKKISNHVLDEMKKTGDFDMFFENKDSMWMSEYDDIVGERIEIEDLEYHAYKYGKLPDGFLETKGNVSSVMTAAEYKALLAEAKEFNLQQKVQGKIKDGDSLNQENPKTDENNKKLAANEIELVDGKGDQLVDEDQDWVQRYEAIMKQYAADNQQEWVREEKNEEGQPYEGLKGKIGEADYHFTAPNRAQSNLAGIDGIVALAQKEGLSLAYNKEWSDEFKAEVMKACEKYGVSIEGMPEQAQQQTKQEEEPTPAPVEEQKEESALDDNKGQTEEKKAEPSYKVNPKISTAKMADYSNKVKTPLGIKQLKTEVEKEEKLLAARAYQSSGQAVEDKVTAEVLMKKYAIAVKEGNQETADTCALALQRYGVENIVRNPNEENGKYTVEAGKPYSERTDEEKAKINEALDKSLPKKQEQYNPEVWNQLAQAKANNTK